MDHIVIDLVQFYKYEFAFSKPVPTARGDLQYKRGVIIEITSSEGIRSFGDIGPLPGFSKESIDDVIAFLPELKEYLTRYQFYLNEDEEDTLSDTRGTQFFPSIQFGIDMALFHQVANKSNKPLQFGLDDQPDPQVKINGLISKDEEDLKGACQKLIDDGFKIIKVKLSNDLIHDIKRIQTVLDVVKTKAQIILDANRQLSFNDAITLTHEVGLDDIKYIEEPFTDISLIDDFAQKTTIPVALDESLEFLNVDQIKALNGVSTLILKPTVVGGINKTIQLTKAVSNQNFDIVISSSFESDLGILTLAQVASATKQCHFAGLDTLKYLETNLLKDPLFIRNGTIDITDRMISEKTVDFSCLSRI